MKLDIYIRENNTTNKPIYFCSIVATSVEELQQTFHALNVPSTFEEHNKRMTESMMNPCPTTTFN